MGGGPVRAWLGPLLLVLVLWSPGRGLATRDCNDRFFFNLSSRKCEPCMQCEGILEYKHRCMKTADAICQCVPRYRCSGNDRECKECICESGQQLTDQGCQSCPDGKFYHQTSGSCLPWTKCPGNKILVNGSTTEDVKCYVTPEGMTTASTTPVTERDGQLLIISIALTVALILCVMSLLILSIVFRTWAQRKLLAVFVKQPLGQLAQEVDDCSCRYPEEEEGGAEGRKGELLANYP